MKTSYQILEDYLNNNQAKNTTTEVEDYFIFNSAWLDRMVWKDLKIQNQDYGILTFFFIPGATRSRKNPFGFGPITIWTNESMFIKFQQTNSPGRTYLKEVANGGIPRTNIYEMITNIKKIQEQKKRDLFRKQKDEERAKALEEFLEKQIELGTLLESSKANGYFYSKFYLRQMLGLLGIDVQNLIFNNTMKSIGFLDWNPKSFQNFKYNMKNFFDATKFNFKPVKKRLVNSNNPFVQNRTQYLLKEEGKRAIKGWAKKDVSLLNDNDFFGDVISANKKDYIEVSEVKRLGASGNKRNVYKTKNKTVRNVQPGNKYAPKSISPAGRGIRFARIILAVKRDYKKK